jgi:nuclear GTP-binding protein
MTKIRKKTSKRVTLKKKYTLQKTVKDGKKKMKKESKKLKAMGMRTNKRKGLKIPNIFPFKEEMLNDIERKENMDKQKKENIKMLSKANSMMAGGTLENYAEQITAKVEKFEEETRYGGLTKEELEEAKQLVDPNSRSMIQSKKAFAKELKKVVEASDVII